jgi:hypothetical protein
MTHYYLIDTSVIIPGAAVSALQFNIIKEEPFTVHNLEVCNFKLLLAKIRINHDTTYYYSNIANQWPSWFFNDKLFCLFELSGIAERMSHLSTCFAQLSL